jgi:hypothetical protein
MTEDQARAGRVAEDAILAAILDGATIAEARKRHGYHTLQRKED